jgi:TP901 family phage tail tape measure protein
MAPRTENLKLIISGDGKLLGAELDKQERHIKQFTDRTQSRFATYRQKLNKSLSPSFSNMLPISGPSAAIAATTAAIVIGSKQLIEYQDKLSTIGINAGLSSQKINDLSDSNYRLAFQTGQDRDKIVDAMNDIYDKTGDFKFVSDAIGGVAMASTAMSAEMADSGRVLSAMKLGMGATADEAIQLFDIMARMGNIGSFTFAQQASQAERLFGSSTLALGITRKNFAEYNAFLQSAKPVFGSADIAGTGIESIMLKLTTDRKKVEKAVGFKMFDEKGAIIDFQKTIKAIAKLSITKRSELFGEFGKAFIPLSSKEGIAVYENYIKEGQKAGFIADAFNKKQSETKYQLNALKTAAQLFADKGLAPAIEEFTKALSGMTSDPQKMKEFTDSLKVIGGAIGFIAEWTAKVISGWKELLGLWGKVNEVIADRAFGVSDEQISRKTTKARFSALTPEVRRDVLNRVKYPGQAGALDRAMNEYFADKKPAVISQTITVLAPAGTTVTSDTNSNNATQQSNVNIKNRGHF